MKLTIVAPHFPPSALPPAQRVRLLVKNLASLDVQTTVITTSAKYREEKEDPWMVELAGNDFKLIEVPSLHFKWTRKLGIGDLGLRMLPFLFFKLLIQSYKDKPDYILYPVPPWYILMIAPIIKKLTKVPYAIDFIDPWVVEDGLNQTAGVKKKISQWIARKLEGWVCGNASIIYAVSEGINNELLKRHPKLKTKKMLAIPYGAEASDFQLKTIKKEYDDIILIRYIGAVWEDAYPVLEALLEAFSLSKFKYELQFIGTSYTGEGLAKPQLNELVKKLNIEKQVTEDPNRKPYKEAVMLQMESDFLLLFGGMKSYYAASKLFGLIVSKKPFLAFLHRDSFPAQFLKNAKYPFLVEYSNENNELPTFKIDNLISVLNQLKASISRDELFEFPKSMIEKHTAFGMTKSFIEPMHESIKRKNS